MRVLVFLFGLVLLLPGACVALLNFGPQGFDVQSFTIGVLLVLVALYLMYMAVRRDR